MGITDIIIFAAITVFLAFRLWSVLGQKEDDEGPARPKINPFGPPERKEEADDAPIIEGRARPALQSALTAQGHAPTSLAGILDQIKQTDASFDEKAFLAGAKKAFEGIVTAFAKGDLSPVARLLGPEVRQPFEAVIAERKEKGETLENKVERIVAADIIGAKAHDKVLVLTVEFVSHQVNVLRDSSGQIVDGTPGKAEEVRDIWIFERDTSAADPNWKLVETRS